MGFPTEFFPVLFAIPRMAGWLAHWKESLDDPDTKIMRPQQVSILHTILHSYYLYLSIQCEHSRRVTKLIKANDKFRHGYT